MHARASRQWDADAAAPGARASAESLPQASAAFEAVGSALERYVAAHLVERHCFEVLRLPRAAAGALPEPQVCVYASPGALQHKESVLVLVMGKGALVSRASAA